jgi:hypothetical protein
MQAVLLRRLAFALTAALVLGACTSGRELGQERAELGDFLLGHVVVVADNAVMGPASRRAEPEDWNRVLSAEITRRFGRYQGDTLYHVAVAVQGYVLAIPGIPLVAAPKSALIIGVTIWDDAAQKKLNDKPHRITVLESLSGETVVSSGLTQTAEQQMQNLSENAVGAIERWMAQQEGWFAPRPGAAPQPLATAAASPATDPSAQPSP